MPVLPLRDAIPSRTFPFVTLGLIAANAAVFLFEQTLSRAQLHALMAGYGLVPAVFHPASVLTSMFLHVGWLHLLGNVAVLWLFGENVEDRLGHGRFALFYLACGAAAALVHTLAGPDSILPLAGSSGAVAGVTGAHIVLFPNARVLTLVWLLVCVDLVELPAVAFLGGWLMLQVLVGIGATGNAGGVAFWALAGGFVSGAALARVLRRPERTKIEWLE